MEKEARRLWNEGDIEKSLEYWSKMGQMAEKVVRNPSKLLIIVRKSIQLCLWRLYGYRAIK